MATAELLREHDVKPTIVRLKIYDYLITQKNHPTADTVYKSLLGEMPTLSKTSVYNTMDLFAEKNLIQAITIEENETRFDADTSDHGHFKCINCGEVFDFNVDLSEMMHSLPKDFSIKERHVYFKGTCPACS
ncbi:MAG: transcriptional repressor [Spirochaetales bacterium]|nr:transcriptional repressor [Spirochaetales bacterium]